MSYLKPAWVRREVKDCETGEAWHYIGAAVKGIHPETREPHGIVMEIPETEIEGLSAEDIEIIKGECFELALADIQALGYKVTYPEQAPKEPGGEETG